MCPVVLGRSLLSGDRIDTSGMDMEMQRRAAEREARRYFIHID